MKIGLALSGGGFRAALFHLGLVRFLRDAGILPHVTHITAVSGGSILAAHLGLNWDRYNGSPSERGPRKLTGWSNRQPGKPETSENVNVVTQYLANDFSILAFKLLALEAGYTYEITWSYR